uniref:Uncharacterized protein n=1 Tax=Tetranychus urticae TaxID=32264 RepID=T1KCY5_TETUR
MFIKTNWPSFIELCPPKKKTVKLTAWNIKVSHYAHNTIKPIR